MTRLGRLRGHLAEHLAARRLSRQDAELWRNATTLSELGEVTAQWLEGRIRWNPNYSMGLGDRQGPDPETASIAAPLAAANRAGFLTWHSQPGETWEHEGRTESQRAEVAGSASWANLERICQASRDAGLLVAWHPPPGASVKGSDRQEACAHNSPDGLSGRAVFDVLDGVSGSAVDEVLASPQVCIADPVGGRPGLLGAALDAFSGRKAPEEAVANDSEYLSPRDAGDTREAVTRAAKQIDLDPYEAAAVLNCLAFHGWELKKPAPESEEPVVLPPSERAKGVEARTHGWDGKPLSEADKRFFALRDSGFTGWIDQDGNKAPCPSCEQQDCTAGLTERCNGAESPTKADRPTSTAAQSGGMGRANSGGTMSVDLELSTATDASTPETLAQALRETADNARRSAVDKDAQAESLRSQAAALQDKPDMSESAQGLLNEAARLAEVAEARRGMAAAYEDKAAQVDAQRTK